jgi:hypothetical protein
VDEEGVVEQNARNSMQLSANRRVQPNPKELTEAADRCSAGQFEANNQGLTPIGA